MQLLRNCASTLLCLTLAGGLACTTQPSNPSRVEDATPAPTAAPTPVELPRAEVEATPAASQPAAKLSSAWQWKDALAGSRVTFSVQDGQVSGSTGVNRYGGEAKIDGEQLSFGPMRMTKRAGPPAHMQKEQEFTQKLAQVRAYVIKGAELRLLGADGSPVLGFELTAVPQLVGTEWGVVGLNNGKGGVSSVMSGVSLTMMLSAEGSVAGSAGCNRYKGSYKQDEAAIKFSQAVATRRLCTEPDGLMQIESQFLQALAKVSQQEVHEGQLYLRDEDGALMLRLAPGSAQE